MVPRRPRRSMRDLGENNKQKYTYCIEMSDSVMLPHGDLGDN